MTDIVVKTLKDIPLEERFAFFPVTMDNGIMRSVLFTIHPVEREMWADSKVYIAIDKREPVALAILRPPDKDNTQGFDVFVRAAYRKQGLGKLLVEKAKADKLPDTKWDIEPFDKRGREFYAAMGVEDGK